MFSNGTRKTSVELSKLREEIANKKTHTKPWFSNISYFHPDPWFSPLLKGIITLTVKDVTTGWWFQICFLGECFTPDPCGGFHDPKNDQAKRRCPKPSLGTGANRNHCRWFFCFFGGDCGVVGGKLLVKENMVGFYFFGYKKVGGWCFCLVMPKL